LISFFEMVDLGLESLGRQGSCLGDDSQKLNPSKAGCTRCGAVYFFILIFKMT